MVCRALFRTPDGQSSLLFMVFGVATVVFGSQYQLGSPSQMGPGFFPTMLGGLLVVVGASVAFQAVRANQTVTMTPTEWRPLIMICASIALAAFLLLTLGLVVAIPAMVFVAALSSSHFKTLPLLATAAILTLMAWAIFILGLGLHIPVFWG